MKIIKIYLVVVTVLLFIGLGFGVYVWYTLQTLSTKSDTALVEPKDAASTAKDSSDEGETVMEPIVVKTADLSDSQQKILESFGFGGETFTVTSAMISCAENAVGKARLQEILDGAAPTPLESIKLLPCFKA